MQWSKEGRYCHYSHQYNRLSTNCIISIRNQVEHKSYHMNIADMSKFEAKLREAEERLGIPQDRRVPVVYERTSDTAGKLLASILVVGLLLAIMTRSKSFKSPISMDSFVSYYLIPSVSVMSFVDLSFVFRCK